MKKNPSSHRSRPFRATPDTRLYFPHPSIEAARETAVRAIVRAEGPAMVLGAAGYGKSLLGDLVAEQLDDRLDVVKLQSARLCSRRALLQNLLFELGLPYRDLSEGELRLSILDRLEPSPETAPEGILIVVDEAHTLHWKLLEELRLISNYTRHGHPRVRLLLLGNLRLEETFTSPHMDSFNQRLAARCYLQPMNREETFEFIKHQFRQAGEIPESRIAAEALQIVYSACEGIPRLVNQLMDHALVMASDRKHACITAEMISEAWADLQQLPAPWTVKHDETHSGPASVSIEFGELEDESLDSTALASEEMEIGQELGAETGDDASSTSPVAQLNNFFSAFTMDALPNDQASREKIQPSIQPSIPDQQIDSETSWASPELPIDELALSVDELSSSEEEDSTEQVSVPEISVSENFSEVGTGEEFSPAKDSAQEAINELALSSPTTCDRTETCDQTTCDQTTCDRAACEQATCDEVASDQSSDGGESDEAPTEFELERIECLQQEQQQFGELGLWEDDPPLLDREPSEAFYQSLEQEHIDAQAGSHSSAAKDIFGDDFDQEFQVPTVATQRPTGTDYLARIENTANMLTQFGVDDLQVQSDELTVGSHTLLSPLTSVELPPELDGQSWKVDIVPDAASSESLEDSIEDIVSQLNFSAFSIEPFSVEQIPLKSEPEAAGWELIKDFGGDQSIPQQPAIGRFAASSEIDVVDDDRDILVIEEEIPPTSRLLDQSLPTEPAQKTVPYAQLFAKLRK